MREAFRGVFSQKHLKGFVFLVAANVIVSWIAVRQGDVDSGRNLVFDIWDAILLSVAAGWGIVLARHTRSYLAAVLASIPILLTLDGLFLLHVNASLALQKRVDFGILRDVIPMTNPAWAKVVVVALAGAIVLTLMWAIKTSSGWAHRGRIMATVLFSLLVVSGPIFEAIDSLTGFVLDLGFTRLDMSLIEETVERTVEAAIIVSYWALAVTAPIRDPELGWRA